MLYSNASIAFDIDPLWWFHSVSTAHKTPHRAGPTKCRALPWHCEYSVWPSTWRNDRASPMIFCAWNYLSGPISRHRLQCDIKIPSDFVFKAAIHKQRNAVQRLLASIRTEPNFIASEQFPWLRGVSKWLVESLPMILQILLTFMKPINSWGAPILAFRLVYPWMLIINVSNFNFWNIDSSREFNCVSFSLIKNL